MIKDDLIIHKPINEIYYFNTLKNKNDMIISIDAQKAIDKNSISIYDFKKNSLESEHNIYIVNLPQYNKAIYDKPTVIILNGEKLRAFLLKSGTRQ